MGWSTPSAPLSAAAIAAAVGGVVLPGVPTADENAAAALLAIQPYLVTTAGVATAVKAGAAPVWFTVPSAADNATAVKANPAPAWYTAPPNAAAVAAAVVAGMYTLQDIEDQIKDAPAPSWYTTPPTAAANATAVKANPAPAWYP